MSGLGQVDLAARAGIGNGSVSKVENGRANLSDSLVESIAKVLDCKPEFLLSPTEIPSATRPWLRAYADAPKRSLDRQVADCMVMMETADSLSLTRIPDTLPVFGGDPSNDEDIELFAAEVRSAAQLGEGDVVGNCIRAAERLGCVVLPMNDELGRHMGLSLRVDLVPIISVSRPSLDAARHVPGDRQRMTVAHEIGHLALHSGSPPPSTATEASQIEKQAFRFAGAFLAPGDAMLEELDEHGGRVTLRTLASIKETWGVAIKALVMRYRSLGVIDDDHARNLYKQISARGYNKGEPVEVGNEKAIWLSRALAKTTSSSGARGLRDASDRSGIGLSHFVRWTEWGPTESVGAGAEVLEMPTRRSGSTTVHRSSDSGTVERLPVRRN